MTPETWWFAARATGLVAFALLGVSVLGGIVLTGRSVGRRPPPDWVLDWHRFVGALSIVFICAHVATIWIDDYIEFGVADLLVPFASDWRPLALAPGIVALYVVVAVEVTSLLRQWLPSVVWRRVHLLSYAAFALGALHLFTAGADAGNPIVLVVFGTLIGATVAVLGIRVMFGTERETAAVRRDQAL